MTRKRQDRPGESGRNEKDSGTMPPREIGRASPEGGDATDGASDKGAPDKGNDFPVTDDDQNFFA
jgi:hypothetical protein